MTPHAQSIELEPSSRRKSFTTRHWLFLLLAIETVVISYTKLYRLFDPQSALWMRYDSVRLLALAHILPGTLAFFIGPFQFSEQFRRHYPSKHRLAGWSYALAIVVSGILSIPLSLSHVSLLPTLAPLVQTIAWISATCIAIQCARRRQLQIHRQWMIRSYAVTTTFVSTRLLFSIPVSSPRTPEAVAIIVLATVATTLILTEIGLYLTTPGRIKAK